MSTLAEHMERLQKEPLAFPRSRVVIADGTPVMIEDWGAPGMTLRDWFAGQALTRLSVVGQLGRYRDCDSCAQAAYAYADAMLVERAKSGGGP